MTRLLLTALASGAALAASSEAVRALAPVSAQVLHVTEAKGPPELTCEQARAEARGALGKAGTSNTPPPAGAKATPSPSVEPDYATMPKVVVDGKTLTREILPGADPDAVPLTPLEGPPVALRAIAAVMHKAAAGGRVRISFFGASHVSGDFFTGQIRRVLQGRYGDLGHGFILPASLYEGARGHDINLCRTDDWFPDWAGKKNGRDDGLLGFAGMSVSSRDPASFGWVETTRSNPQGRQVSRYDIYAVGQPEGGSLEITVDDAAPRTVSTLLPAPELLRWRVSVPDGPHRLTLSPAGDGEVRLVGVSAERDGKGVIVDAMGVRGKTARSMLQWDRTQAAQGLLTLSPDLIVLAYGTNEAADVSYTMDTYRADLRAVLTEVRRVLPDRACILVGPSDRAVQRSSTTFLVWDRTEPVAQVQREVAPEFQCAFWDLQRASGGPGSMIAWRLHDPAWAASDLIHFSAAGYSWLGDRFVAALDQVAAR